MNRLKVTSTKSLLASTRDTGLRRNTSFVLGSFLFALALLAGMLVSDPRNVNNPLFYAQVATTVSPSGDNWLKIDGRSLTYNGQVVHLRGANFANINALGARTDANNRIGTGRPQDVLTNLADYQKLRSMGGNHVRFGLDYYWYLKYPDQFWSMLDQQISYAKQAGLWMMLLSFGNPSKNGTDSCYEGYSNPCDIWDSATDQQRLIDWWKAIVTRYKNEPTVAIIDPVNEPTVGASRNWSADYWWKIAERLRDNVVAINPNMLVSIEAGSDALFWRSLGKNVLYQAHYYTPLGGTHCPYNSGGVQYRYPGAAPLWDGSNPYFDKANLNNESAKASVYQAVPAIRWSQQNNVPLYIGEWGIATESCYPGGIQYMADVAELFNREGLSWAWYSWEASEQRWGTFREGGSLVPYSQAKYDMLITALKDTASPPQATAISTTRTPIQTSTIVISLTATKTLKPPTATPTLAVASSTLTPTMSQVICKYHVTGWIGSQWVDICINIE